MRLMFGLVLILGIALAGFAVYMARSYIQNYQTALEQERQARPAVIDTVDVYVTTRLLQYGEQITSNDVQRVAYPTGSLPEGVFRTEDDLFPKGTDAPRSALRSMEKAELVLSTRVSEPGEDAGIMSRLERGMRAFAIKVDSMSGVSGFLRPGDRVDVYWTGNIGRGDLRTEGDSVGEVTKLIQSGVKLIAIDQSSNVDMAEASIARTVTVAVRPEQVAALAQAQATGRLALSLMGTHDDTIAGMIEVDQRQLLGLAAAPMSVSAPAAEACTIRVRRGSDIVETQIPCTN